jgi:hypothetical protein
MLVIGIGLGMAMQPLILAVQNAVEARDMGVGTSTATFFRSLGGSVGVAALGAVMSNRLATELAPLMAAALKQLPPAVAAQLGPRVQGLSINDPASIKALPVPVQSAIEHGFVNTLHPIFLAAGLVSLLAVVLCLMLPNRELRGSAPPSRRGAHGRGAHEPGKHELRGVDEETETADAEAHAATMI